MSENNLNAESIRLQEQFISMGAKISEAIRDAVRDAADSVDASVAQRVGKSLVSTFTSLARFAEEAAENTFKISQGLLDSEGISKQLLNLEQKRLTLSRQKELAQLAGIKYNEDDYQTAKESIAAQEKMLQNEKALTDSIDKKVGLVGKLASAMGAIPGLGKIINAKEINEELRKAAVELDKDGKLIEINVGKFKMMAIAAKTVGKQFATAMLDPLTIVTALVKKFLEIDEASVELHRLTGQTGLEFGDMNLGAATTAEILKTQVELTKQTGMNVQSAFSKDVIIAAANLQAELGLAADEAGALAMMAQTSGASVESLRDNIVDTTSAFNKSNRSAISQGVVLKDVAKTSNAIKLSLGNNDVAIAKAAAQARRLGMDLNQVDKIAESLLNFESSIESELEAQLLTGNQINMSKAREMALTGKTAELGDELFKNSVDIHRFGEMTRLGQEAQAKALGMTRDELARVAYLRAIDNNMTEEAAAAAADVNAEDMKRLTVQKNIASSMDKITQAFAPLLEYVAKLLGHPIFGQIIIGAAILIPLIATLAGGMTAYATAQSVAAIATATQTTATLLQAGANSTLATTQTIMAASAAPAAGGFVAMGTALRAFGAAAAPAIPVLLSIAAVAAGIGLAFAGVGFALMQIPKILEMITAEKAMGMLLLGQAFGGLALGLAAIAIAGLAALPVLMGLQNLGVLGGSIAMQAAAPPGAISGAQKPIESPQAPAASLSLDPLVTEIKLMKEEMTALMRQFIAKELVVKIDSYAVMQAGQTTRVAD